MVTSLRRLSRWCFAVCLLAAGCTAALQTEPVAEPPAATGGALAPVSVSPEAYPPPDTATPTLPPYPWPTRTPPPTDPPTATEEPTETIPPVPTMLPTPVVTPIPTAAPPIIPFPDGTTAQPFTLFWREGDVIRSLRSEGQAAPEVFLDPAAEFSLFLTPEEAYGLSWGAISPDGKTFALVLAEEPNPVVSLDTPYSAHIYLLDRVSQKLHPLVMYGVDPVWSPDGLRLAYISTETGGLRVLEFTGGETHKIYELYTPDRDNAHNVTSFSWSSDGRNLAILDKVYFESSALFIVDAEQETPPISIIDPTPQEIYGPQWSPVNDQIVFLWPPIEPGSNLWMIDKDGTDRKQIFYDISILGGQPLWSPDGKWIVLSGPADYEAISPRSDIWLIDSTGSTLKRLTHNQMGPEDAPGNDALNPIWSPDGKQLVFFSASPDGLQEVWMMSLVDGGSQKLLAIGDALNVGLVIAP